MSYVIRWTPTLDELKGCKIPEQKMVYWGIEAQDPKVEDDPLEGQRRYFRVYWFGYEPSRRRIVEGYSRGVSRSSVKSVEDLVCSILGGRLRRKRESFWKKLILGPEPEEHRFTVIHPGEMSYRKVVDLVEGVDSFVKPQKLDIIIMFNGLTEEEIQKSGLEGKKFVPMPYALKY